uniref:VWFA domain-containing protein n=1 Tax=Strigamia maritima TaxID=126957 RepID=T1JCB1_STRMM
MSDTMRSRRTHVVLTALCLIVTAFGGTCAQLLRFENNSYEGILVAIAPHVPYSKADQLITEIKDLFERASKVLFKATYQHASYGQVTIIVPETWTEYPAEKDAYYGYHEAHVRIENPSSIHGNTPYTQQPGGCGRQGDFIHLTPDFLMNKNKSESDYGRSDKVFVHEWAHFRYGVFDEYGYPGDAVYPQMYIKDTDTPKLTTCAYPDLNVRFKNCTLDQHTGTYNQSCKYELNESQISTSSLMGFHYLDQVDYFCDNNKHETDAPTKQNILCDGKSTWEVIERHKDFEHFNKNRNGFGEPKPITFNFVRAVKSPVFVVVDVSTDMKGTNDVRQTKFQDTAFPLHQNRFKFVKQALRILPHMLPDNAYIGIQTFDSSVNSADRRELVQVKDMRKDNFAVTIEATNLPTNFGAMYEAITVARRDLKRHNGGILLLLTSGVNEPYNMGKIDTLCHDLQRENVRVMSIHYPPWPKYQAPLRKHMTLLADRTNGRNFAIHEMTIGHNTNLNVLAQLTSAMLKITQAVEPYNRNNFVVQTEGSYNDKVIKGSFYVDKTIGNNTKIIIIRNKKEDVSYKDIALTTPSEETFRLDDRTYTIIDSDIMIQPLSNEFGRWNYSIPTQTSLANQDTVSVFAFSYPSSEEGTYTVRTWNNAKMGELDPSEDTPLILYAEVKKGNDPVVNARVIAKVHRPLDNDKYSTIEVELFDNGNAPDLTKNDGIYSRYFTDFNVRGHYLITVVASSNEDTIVVTGTSATSSIHPLDKSISYCCGSVVPITKSIPADTFSRVTNGGVFHITNMANTTINFPPSRITDLRIKEFRPQFGQVVLTWTAPGNSYDKGKASRYEVKYSPNRKLLLDPALFGSQDSVSNIPQPATEGSTQEITISPILDSAPKVVHYAMRTFGNLNKESGISNLVTVVHPAKHLTTPAEGPDSTIPSSQNPPATVATHLSKVHLGIIGGTIAFLLLLIIIVVITICIIKKRKKKAEPKPVLPLGSPKKETSFKNVPLDESPSTKNGNGSVYTVNEVMSSPQFMLASEVLAKHAQMKATKEKDYLDQDLKPPYADDENHYYSPAYDHINPVLISNYPCGQPNPSQDYYISRHDTVPNNNPFVQNYPSNYPFVRTSLSDKPSSSFTSLSTNEPKKDNGYFTSYEETSEDSNHMRPSGEMDNGLTSSKSSLARRIVAESQSTLQHIPLVSTKMDLQWITLVFTILPLYSSSISPLSKISLVNNQYQRVSIELSPDISENEFDTQVIHSLKEIFKNASAILELATHKITSFGKIKIIVPSSWKNKSGLIESTILSTEFHLSPFRIDNSHPIYGDEPYTLQPQQCGEQGLYIHLTPNFISPTPSYNGKNIRVAARKLVQNWIRYRYGVFPETGDHFHKQLQFPTFYATEDGLKPTGCNNQPLDVEWINCFSGSKECTFNLNLRQDKELTTSLMSWPNLEEIKSFCDKNDHNSLAPTIHNVLCQSRSVWDVLRDHEDFRTNKIPTGATALNVPEFEIVRKEDPKRVVIIIDTSSDHKNKVKLTTILAALNRFIMIYLPDNAQAAVIHYSDRLYLTKNLTNLDPVSRKHIRRTFLDYLELKNKAILARALEKAFESFFREIGGICIVISTGRFDPELKSEEKINNLQQILKSHHITLTAIVLGEAKEDKHTPSFTTTEALQTLSKLSGGEFLAVYEKQSSLNMLTQVDRILLQTAKLTNPQLLQVGYEVMPSGVVSQEFYIDEDSSTEMVFSVTLENELWPVVLISPTGQEFRSHHYSYSDSENLKQVSFTIPSANIGKWTYRIQTGNSNINSAISVTSLSNKTKRIELEGWITVKKSNVSTWPIIIYGKLMRGSNPVINAQVQATVIGTTEHTIVLKDTGNGDPDVFKQDGVYSRYIPGHLKMGFYTVWLTASDNGTSKTNEQIKIDFKDQINKQPTGPFQRIASLGSFYVDHSGDICPPSRIADLHFLLASKNKVRLGWTEPGNDFDSGKVARYRFWWSDKVNCLTHMESACRSELFPQVPVWPKGSGNYQAADVLLTSMPSRVMFIAITAEDSAHNPSPTSNTIAISWTQVHPGLDDVHSSAILDKLPEGFLVTRKHCNIQCLQGSSLVVIIVGAVIIALILVAIVITLCFTEQSRTRRNQNPILRPRLDIRPEVGSESASPEIVASTASNEESDNHLAIILDQEPTDVSSEEPKNECKEKEPIKKIPTDDVLTYYPLLDERKKSFTILHRPNCLINAHITQCALVIACSNDICEARSPFLQVKDNSYQNVVVAISSTVDQDEDLIEEIQTLLTTASQQLFIASKQHVYFKDITILVPSSWHQLLSEPIQAATYESFEEADIQIGSSNIQNTPYTKQHGGCGERGLNINLSPDFILSSRNDTNPISNAKKIVRAWAYYQYGVFEECGYPHDALFPQFYYQHQHKLTVTGCLEKPHDYTFQGDCTVSSLSGIPDTNCEFSLNNNTSATTSLLNNPSLEQIAHFCDAKTHDSHAPTKQNFFCREKSAWEVIKSNSDFANLKPMSDSNTITTPSYKFVLMSNVTYVVLLDQSNPMKNNYKFEAAQAVITRFFKDHVPDGSAVALTAFADRSSILCNETMINDEISRDRVISSIPDNVQIAHQADITAGILTSAYIFNPRNSTIQKHRRILIIITAGKWLPTDVVAMCETLNSVKIRVMIIVCHDEDRPLNKEITTAFQELALCTRGNIFNIPAISEYNYPLAVERLEAAMRATVSPNDLEDRNVQVSSEYYSLVFMKHFGKSSVATISGNFTLDKSISDSVFRVSYEQNKNVEKVILTRPDGILYDGVYDKKAALGPAITYYFNHVQVGDPTSVILYAEVKQMNGPIVNADVVATIHAPQNSYQISLYDSGTGDPDISENDGIYSRYLIHLPTPGFYSIEVNAEDREDGSTRVYHSISTSLNKSSDCQQPIYTGSPIGTFKRFAVGPSFYVPKAEADAIYPPNRISNLRIHKVNSSTKQIQLEWSPAGEDLDSEEKAKSPKLTAEFNLPNDNTLYYFAVQARDSQGYQNEMSNIVSAFIASLPTETTTNSSRPLETDIEKTKGASAARTGPIIGIIVAVVLVLVILVVVWRITSNRRQKKAQIKKQSASYERVSAQNVSIKPINEESEALTGSVDETVNDAEVKKSPKNEQKTEADADLSSKEKSNAKGDDDQGVLNMVTTEQANQSIHSCECQEIPITTIIGSLVGGLVILGIVNVIVWYIILKKKVTAKEKVLTNNTIITPEPQHVVTFSKELEQATVRNHQQANTSLNHTMHQNVANNKEEEREKPEDGQQVRKSILALIPHDKKAAVYALASVMPKMANKQENKENEVQIPSLTGSADSFQTTTCDDDGPIYNEIDYKHTHTSNIQLDSDGGFTNIVVSLSGNVEYSEAILLTIQEFITKASEQLFIATFHRTYFKSITIIVPKSWPLSVPISTNLQIADIKIDNTNELFQNQNVPYTQQPRGCGEEGNFIYLTAEYMNKWEKNKDNLLVKRFILEWAKLRYGIFEETMFPFNFLVPTRYNVGCKRNPTWQISDSSDFSIPTTNIYRYNPNFTFVRKAPMAIVIVIDPNLCSPDTENSILLLTLLQFITLMPKDTSIGFVIANVEIETMPIIPIEMPLPQHLYNEYLYNLTNLVKCPTNVPTNFKTGLDKAIKMLQEELNHTKHLILLANGFTFVPVLMLNIQKYLQTNSLTFFLLTWNPGQLYFHYNFLKIFNDYQHNSLWFNIPIATSLDQCNVRYRYLVDNAFVEYFNRFSTGDLQLQSNTIKMKTTQGEKVFFQSPNISIPNIVYGYYSGNLLITAKVVTPSGKDQFIELRDNGNGDPDGKAGDGIFSRYLIYPNMATGVHSISIIVTDKSEIMLERDLGSFILQSVESKIMPPSWIGDFHAQETDPSDDVISFQWTAPGGDFDHDSVIAYFLNCASILTPLDQTAGEEIDLVPKESGKDEIWHWNITSRNTLYHCGIWSTDIDNNTSEISNIITVYLPELPITSTINAQIQTSTAIHNNESTNTKGGSGSKSEMGIIIGSFAFFTQASEQLYVATFNHTFFKTITITVPNSWPISMTSTSHFETANIQIDNTNKLFQNQNVPYTQQPRSCGEKGNFIYLTTEYLTTWNDTKDNVLVKRFIQEWAKLRYGIFDETGNKMSAKFPDTYLDVNGTDKETGCSSHDPQHPNNCKTIDGVLNCTFDENETILSMQSSIMDDSVDASVFCTNSGQNLHNYKAPTRHNALCRRKSTWQIISETSDFTTLANRELITINVKPTVTYVKKLPMAIVIVIDPLLGPPNVENSFLWYSLAHFINLLPEHASIGFVKASTPNMTITINQTRNIIDNIHKFNYDLRLLLENAMSNSRSIENGITTALQMLEEKPNHTKHLILITDGSALNPNSTLSIIEEHLQNKVLTFFLLTWILEGTKLDFPYDSMKIFLDYQLNSLWFNIKFPLSLHECNPASKYAIEDAFVEYFNRFSKDYLESKPIKLKTIPSAGKSEFTIPVKNAIVNFKTFYCDKFQKELKLTINNKEYYTFQLDTDNFITSFMWTSDSFENNQVSFMWEIKDDYREKHRTSIWSVNNLIPFAGQLEKSKNISFPNILYGYYSGNLLIKAKVVTPSGNDEFIQLRDNGNGDPDVKEGDGIFSRYLIYPNMIPGEHFISLIATDSAGETMLQTDLGSFILPSIEMKNIPPNRIADFHLKNIFVDNGIVSFYWTSPGGDLDHNSATAYFLSCASESSIMDKNISEKLNIKPQESGKNEIGEWRITSRDTLYNCGLLTIDNDNNTSELSNIITIYMPDLPTTTSTVEETTSMLTTELGELPSNSTVTNRIEIKNLTQSENQFTTLSTDLSIEIDVSSTSNKGTNKTEAAKQCLSTIEIAGIAVGCVVFVLIIIVCLFILRKCKHEEKTTKQFNLQLSSSMPNNRADVIRAPSNRSSTADIESISNDININAMSTFNPQTSFRSKSNIEAQLGAMNQNIKFEEDLPAYKPPDANLESDLDEEPSQYPVEFNHKSNAPSESNFKRKPQMGKAPHIDELYAKIDKRPMYLQQKLASVYYFLLFAILSKNSISIGISLNKNGYTGIIVAFSPNVKEQEGLALIPNIKELFTNASKVLYKATYQRVYFQEITILLPETWKKNPNFLPATNEYFNLAAVRIDELNSVNDDFPYTLQHMGCSYQGLYIHLTVNYLKNLKLLSTKTFGDPGKTLVHEWAHYRYGIFDEYGYPGHERYPMFYLDPNTEQLVPNYCSDQPITGRFWNTNDDEPCLYDENGFPDKKCMFVPAVNKHNQIKTSLSSYSYLQNVEFFCNETNHNHYAPNSQNLLCNQKSAWEVIMESQDLAMAKPTNLDPASVKFNIIQSTESTFILVLDISGSMIDRLNEKTNYTKLEMLQDTVNRWINYEVKFGWSVGIISFNATAYTSLHPTKVTDDSVRTKITKSIPDYANGGTCIGCGLQKAMKDLKKYKLSSGGTIILVSDGEESPDTLKVEDVIKELEKSRIRVISIVFTQSASQTLEQVATVTNGRTFFVSNENGIEAMASALFEAVAHQETYINTTVKISESQFDVRDKGIINSSFVIDRTIGNRVTISFSYQRKNGIANITIIDSIGNIIATSNSTFNHTTQTGVSVKKDLKSFHFIFNHLKPGLYNYSIKAGRKRYQIINVNIVSDAYNRTKPITAKCWYEIETKNEKQLIVFAEVKQGNSPVVQATVSAEIERPDGSVITMQLLDNGNGPDVFPNDGIYSKYFTLYVKESGRYTVKATVIGNQLSTIRQAGFIGSRIIAVDLDYMQNQNLTESVPTGSFERVSNGGSFQPAQNFTSKDTIPPIKVYDLKLINISADRIISIQWTAPGDDLDDGTVTKYDIQYSSNVQRLSAEFNSTQLNTSHIIPVASGQIQIFSAEISQLSTNSVIYMALKAADDVFNWSKMSNIITIISPIFSTINNNFTPEIQYPKQISKVFDLKLVNVYQNGTVLLQWTAPDHEFRKKVYEYAIKYSDHIGMIANEFEGSRVNTIDLKAVKPGQLQSFVFTFPQLSSTKNTFLALRACDRYYNWSPISNVVVIKKPIATPYRIPISIKLLIIIIISVLLLFVVLNITVWYLKFK